MKDREAIDIVIRAAEGNASGHQDCLKIHEAIARVKVLLETIFKPKKRTK